MLWTGRLVLTAFTLNKHSHSVLFSSSLRHLPVTKHQALSLIDHARIQRRTKNRLQTAVWNISATAVFAVLYNCRITRILKSILSNSETSDVISPQAHFNLYLKLLPQAHLKLNPSQAQVQSILSYKYVLDQRPSILETLKRQDSIFAADLSSP